MSNEVCHSLHLGCDTTDDDDDDGTPFSFTVAGRVRAGSELRSMVGSFIIAAIVSIIIKKRKTEQRDPR